MPEILIYKSMMINPYLYSMSVISIIKMCSFYNLQILCILIFYFLWLYGTAKKLYLQAEPRVCEQPVFTAQQNYILVLLYGMLTVCQTMLMQMVLGFF